MPLSGEEALKRIEDQAAMVRALADLAAASEAPLSPSALSGMADACGQIEELTRNTRKALSPDALCEPVSSWADPDDAPEMDEEWFENATLSEGAKVIKQGKRVIPGVESRPTDKPSKS